MTTTRVFHSMHEVARVISANYWFVRDEIERGRLVAHKFGKRLKVSEADLEDYLARARGAKIEHRVNKQVPDIEPQPKNAPARRKAKAEVSK
jgi:excisionase family DNA binding protein